MPHAKHVLTRRQFVHASALATGTLLFPLPQLRSAEYRGGSSISIAELPKGSAPKPVGAPHFPDRLHAFVWRNWSLVPIEKIASVVGATSRDMLRIGRSLGLPKPPRITADRQRRSYITVIRRNWHLLPYEQLLQLLDWTPEQMAYTLREDDFLYVKLGNLKPQCESLRYSAPTPEVAARAQTIAHILTHEFPTGLNPEKESLFEFVQELSTPSQHSHAVDSSAAPNAGPRFCYSYFALYGDPLLEPEVDPYPEGYLARLAQTGVNGVWLQAVLYKLAPFPWDPTLSIRHEERLKNLRQLVERAKKHRIGIYLYLNEPRSMPLAFFAARPELKGVVEGDHAALCSSAKPVQSYIQSSIASLCRAVPDLAGLFTITASENLTNCWSHGAGQNCPRCGERAPAHVIAEVNGLIAAGIREAKASAKLIAWDWGWSDGASGEIIRQLPKEAALMSVSEWSLPIERGGIRSEVGEYSISSVGPGPRATQHWNSARSRGLKTLAKIQAGNTWELSAVPYIPAVANVAQHAANLRETKVDGLMLGWTLGGYPSPNLEVVAEVLGSSTISTDEAMRRVAERRFGKSFAPSVVIAWKQYSAAFSEFPYHGGVVYSAPLQVGPANPLWSKSTGYASAMVGIPYDHLEGWRAVYPTDVFIRQLETVAGGFESGLAQLRSSTHSADASRREQSSLAREMNVAEAAALHFKSVANQARFVRDRDTLAGSSDATRRHGLVGQLEETLRDELMLAKRLFAIQSRDSRIGFEASNHYFYIPLDLAEKVINCRDLLDRWLPEVKRSLAGRT